SLLPYTERESVGIGCEYCILKQESPSPSIIVRFNLRYFLVFVGETQANWPKWLCFGLAEWKSEI
ncbi:2398_t:CDS:2, partial [Acaulospora colombiana]